LPVLRPCVSDPVAGFTGTKITKQRMKTDTRNKTGNGNNATAALAKINAQIEALNQQRIGLAQPLKERYAEMRGELSA